MYKSINLLKQYDIILSIFPDKPYVLSEIQVKAKTYNRDKDC